LTVMRTSIRFPLLKTTIRMPNGSARHGRELGWESSKPH
jgi:hypothetical protein